MFFAQWAQAEWLQRELLKLGFVILLDLNSANLLDGKKINFKVVDSIDQVQECVFVIACGSCISNDNRIFEAIRFAINHELHYTSTFSEAVCLVELMLYFFDKKYSVQSIQKWHEKCPQNIWNVENGIN